MTKSAKPHCAVLILTAVILCGCVRPDNPRSSTPRSYAQSKAAVSQDDKAVLKLAHNLCDYLKNGGDNDTVIRFIKNNYSVAFQLRMEVSDKEIEESATTLDQVIKEYSPIYGQQFENTNLSSDPIPGLTCETGKPAPCACPDVYAAIARTLDYVKPYDASKEEQARVEAEFVAMKTGEFEAFAKTYGPTRCLVLPVTLKSKGSRDKAGQLFAGLFKQGWRILFTDSGLMDGGPMEPMSSECGWLINNLGAGYRSAMEMNMEFPSAAAANYACTFISGESDYGPGGCLAAMKKTFDETCRPNSYEQRFMDAGRFEITATSLDGCCFCATEISITPDPGDPSLCTPGNQCVCEH